MSDFAVDPSAFPELPRFHATWAPIYLEPIIGSGERVTIAIAAIADNGSICVHPVLKEDNVRCFLGSAASRFLNLARLCIESARRHLETEKSLEDWIPPLEGAMLGEQMRVYSKDMTGVIRMAVKSSAFLSSLPDILDAEYESEPAADDARKKWVGLVKEAVVSRAPKLGDRFNKLIDLKSKNRSKRIDYFGERLVAQLGRLIPGRGLGQHIRSAKISLWELDVLRIMREDMPIISLSDVPNDRFELILYRPRDDDPAYSDREIKKLHEALSELEEEGDQHNLIVRPVFDASEAAEEIIRSEAA